MTTIDESKSTASSSRSACWQARDAWWKCLDLYDDCEVKCSKQIEQLHNACSDQLVRIIVGDRLLFFFNFLLFIL